MVCQLRLPPLGPYKMCPLNLALIFLFLVVVILALPNEALCFLPMPPGSPLDNLLDRRVIIAATNVEFEVVAAQFWLDIFIRFI
jgi:hypothetical protein